MSNDNTTPAKAAEYDRHVRQVIPFYEEGHRQAVDLVKAVCPEPRIWLDTGSGTGHLVMQALPLFPTTHFVLVDPSPDMLAEAGKKFGERFGHRVRVLGPCGTEALSGLEAFRPDVITAIQAHHYLKPEGRRKAVRVCHDLLPEDGLLVTMENVRPDTGFGLETALKRWGGFQRSVGRTEKEIADHAGRVDRNYFPITVAEHLGLLRETGFRVVELFWFSCMQAGFYALK